jgi:exonuclease SbcD
VADAIEHLLKLADPDLPLVLAAHASVQGASFGSERAVMLGQELVLSGSVVMDPRFDYVALGHIHKHQSLNAGLHPPVVYAGSIERIDFGECREQKGYVVAEVSRGRTAWQFKPLKTRPFLDFHIRVESADEFMAEILAQLPAAEEVAGAICRLQLEYARELEPLLDEAAVVGRFASAFSCQLLKHRELGSRSRLPDTVAVESLGPDELLRQYWRTLKMPEDEMRAMEALARETLGLSEQP